MQIFRSFESLPPNSKISLAIGNFDGVHLGHAKIIEKCKTSGFYSAILTFDVHPRKFLYPDFAPELLTLPYEKYAFIKSLGVDFIIELPFAEYYFMEPIEFLDLLNQKLNLQEITVGLNFFFGKNQRGNAELLFWWGHSSGVKINVAPPFLKNGMRISSTSIREFVLSGQISNAALFSLYPFVVSGTVKRGKQIGRTLNHPTLNLEPPKKILPPDGVYLTRTLFDNQQKNSLTNIGNNLTIDAESKQKSIETWVDDSNLGELYGKKISVYFLSKIRDEIRFSSKQKLAETIEKDREKAKKLWREKESIKLVDIFNS